MAVYNFFPVPCIQFKETVYDVVEADEEVEVCVITCSDIADRVIKAHVFGPSENVYIPIPQIPPGSMLASKL